MVLFFVAYFPGQKPPKGPFLEPFCLSTFPWVVLTTHESNLLSRHAQNLVSDDSRDAEASCHALLDVVLDDFPPEIFLQRPALIQGLFGMLESKNAALLEPAFACVAELTHKFAVRFYQVRKCGYNYDRGGHDPRGGDGDCSMSVLPASGEESQAYSRSSITSLLSSRSSFSGERRDSLSANTSRLVRFFNLDFVEFQCYSID